MEQGQSAVADPEIFQNVHGLLFINAAMQNGYSLNTWVNIK